MAKFFKKGRKKRAPLRKRAAGGRKTSVSAGVKKYVKKVISAEIENKSVQVNQQISFGNVNESPDFNAFPMNPQTGFWVISQGVGAGARVGNRIKIKSVHLNYVLRPNPYDVTFNTNPVPVNVLLYLGYVKNAPSFVPNATDVTQFFQAGNSVQAPFGTLKDTVAIINKDYWVIKKKWMEKIGYAINDGTGSVAPNQYFANNDYKMNSVKRINITNMCQKTCVFNDNAGGITNRNLYFMYQAVSASGFATGATTLTANIDYWVDFVYEDA